MIRLAVFDIAGTTIEEHQAVYSVLEAAVTAAGAKDPDVQPWMGADKRTAIAALLGEDASAARVETTFEDFRARLAKAYADVPPVPMPGVPDALATLRAHGVQVALTTGFDREVTDSVLAAVGWDDALLDAVVCADDVPAGRPAPYMIFRAMEACGIQAVSEVLVAGDTVLDLRAGTNAGAARVIGVLSGGQDRATLESEPHTDVLDGVAGIPDLLGYPG